MLDSFIVDTIRRLLAEGKWSMRKIARMTGVSRGTVLAIAHGKRRDRIRRYPGGRRPGGPAQRAATALSRLRGTGANALPVVPRPGVEGLAAIDAAAAPPGPAAASGTRRRASGPLRRNPRPARGRKDQG